MMLTARLPQRPLHRLLATILAAVIGLWLAAAVALGDGTTLYAAPGAPASGSCTAAQPCDLSFAISQAVAGSTVIVTPGTYSIATGVVIDKAITVRGSSDHARPSLVGTASLMNDVLSVSAGATVRHLDVETTTVSATAQNAALVIDGATAEDITASAGAGDAQGEAIAVKDSAAGTTLRTALAVSAASGGEAISFKDSTAGAGTATVVNVTAVSTSSSTNAVDSNVVAGSVSLHNVIATGAGTDIATKPGTQALHVDHSDFATTTAGAVADGGGNTAAPPAFVNATTGDYHEAAGSPTIASGSRTSTMSANDLDGHPWPEESSPDMGAYEFHSASGDTTTSDGQTGTNSHGEGQGTTTSGNESPAAPSPSAQPSLAPASPPVPGVSVTLRPASGSVRVELPGTHAFVGLSQSGQVPVGTVIDTTAGAVTLTSASGPKHATKSGTFRGGRFAVTQTGSAHPLTLLRLTGSSFAACPVARANALTRALSLSSAPLSSLRPFIVLSGRPHRAAHHVVRQLWGSDNGGSFVTIGRSGSAAVRGTVWLTQDRCDGTLVRVLRGRVFVRGIRARTGRTISAGHQYLLRAR